MSWFAIGLIAWIVVLSGLVVCMIGSRRPIPWHCKRCEWEIIAADPEALLKYVDAHHMAHEQQDALTQERVNA